jgi:hypothetical protein
VIFTRPLQPGRSRPQPDADDRSSQPDREKAAAFPGASAETNPGTSLLRAARRYSYAALLLCGLGSFALGRSGNRDDELPSAGDAERNVASAASLLDHSAGDIRATSRASQSLSDRTLPGSDAVAANKVPPGTGTATATNMIDLPTSSLTELRDFARAHGRPDVSNLVRLSDNEAKALDSNRRSRSAVAASSTPAAQRVAPAPIPERIEGVTTVDLRGDALGSFRVRAIRKLPDADNAPWAVREIRSESGTTRVRLSLRTPGAGWEAVPGWLEAGDSPARGWRLLAISAQEVLVATPLGNLMQLPLRPESVPAADAHRRQGVSDRTGN